MKCPPSSRKPRIAEASTRILILALLFLLSQSTVSTAKSRPSNKWRICFNHRAESAGEIVFSVKTIRGELVEVRASIEEGMGENTVAKVVRDAFRNQLPPELFHIERDDGEDVLVKKRRGAENFELHLMNSSVENVHIKIKRE